MTILAVCLLFFLATALGGAVLARSHVRSEPPPHLLVLGHPLLAASGLILLGGAYVRSGGPTTILAALIVLATAAGMGMVVAAQRVNRGRAPLPWIAIHVALALAGVALIAWQLVAGGDQVPPPA